MDAPPSLPLHTQEKNGNISLVQTINETLHTLESEKKDALQRAIQAKNPSTSSRLLMRGETSATTEKKLALLVETLEQEALGLYKSWETRRVQGEKAEKDKKENSRSIFLSFWDCFLNGPNGTNNAASQGETDNNNNNNNNHQNFIDEKIREETVQTLLTFPDKLNRLLFQLQGGSSDQNSSLRFLRPPVLFNASLYLQKLFEGFFEVLFGLYYISYVEEEEEEKEKGEEKRTHYLHCTRTFLLVSLRRGLWTLVWNAFEVVVLRYQKHRRTPLLPKHYASLHPAANDSNTEWHRQCQEDAMKALYTSVIKGTWYVSYLSSSLSHTFSTSRARKMRHAIQLEQNKEETGGEGEEEKKEVPSAGTRNPKDEGAADTSYPFLRDFLTHAVSLCLRECPEVKHLTKAVLRSLLRELVGSPLFPSVESAKEKKEEEGEEKEKAKEEAVALAYTLATLLFHRLPIYEESLTRIDIRFIYKELLTEFMADHYHHPLSGDEEGNRAPLFKKKMEEFLFMPVLRQWSSLSFLEGHSLTVNASLAQAVMYICYYYHYNTSLPRNNNNSNPEKVKISFPSFLLSPLLNGVTNHLNTVKSTDLKDDGMRVAGAFVEFFYNNNNNHNSEIAERFFDSANADGNQFKALIDEWLAEERSLDYNSNSGSGPILPPPSSLGPSRALLNHNHNNNNNAPMWTRKDGHLSFPLSPDAPYRFFQRRGEIITSHIESNNNNNKTLYTPNDPHINSTGSQKPLLSFGMTSFTKDIIETQPRGKPSQGGSHAAPPEPEEVYTDFLVEYGTLHYPFDSHRAPSSSSRTRPNMVYSIKQCYDLLLGVGRGGNAQQIEIEKDNETALKHLLIQLHGKVTQLFVDISKLHHRVDTSSTSSSTSPSASSIAELFLQHQQELQPLLSSLLSALISMQLICPAQEKQFFSLVKQKVLLYLIVLHPKLCLYYFSKNILFGNKIGLFTKVELIRVIRDAAVVLSGVRLIPPPSASLEGNRWGRGAPTEANKDPHTPDENKRLYPPIPSAPGAAVSSAGGDNTSTVSRRAIVVSEGKNTRRWGNAVRNRFESDTSNSTRPKKNAHTLNLFAELFYADFFNCFLSRVHEEGSSFLFFTLQDPYSPAEILKLWMVLFSKLTGHYRRSIFALFSDTMTSGSNNNNTNLLFLFLLSVIQNHPNYNIIKLAYFCLCGMFCCWCGAPPLVMIELHPDAYYYNNNNTNNNSGDGGDDSGRREEEAKEEERKQAALRNEDHMNFNISTSSFQYYNPHHRNVSLLFTENWGYCFELFLKEYEHLMSNYNPRQDQPQQNSSSKEKESNEAPRPSPLLKQYTLKHTATLVVSYLKDLVGSSASVQEEDTLHLPSSGGSAGGTYPGLQVL